MQSRLKQRLERPVAGVLAAISLAAAVSFAQPSDAAVLVYDNNTVHQLAQTAANNVASSVVVAGSSNFNTQLGAQAWDYVLVDAPGTIPTGGWGSLITFINNGGRVAMSFWDWDNNSGLGDPGLLSAFGLTSTTSITLGSTLSDTGASSVFAGVTMPNSDWHSHWGDDGDAFGLAAGSVGLATLAGFADPVMVLGNDGRTIASFVIDEAGDTWLQDGSGVQLWENMAAAIGVTAIPEPGTLAMFGLGLAGLGFVRRRKAA